MRILDRCRGACLTFAVLAGTTVGWAQGVSPLGGEYNLIGYYPGDQVLPVVALSPSTRVVAYWNQGQGIFAGDLDNSYQTTSVFKVHKTASGTNDQIRPAVAVLRGGQTAFAWQSKAAGDADIYVRFASGANFSSKLDVRVNSYVKDQQVDPVITALPDGGAMVAWSSYGQNGSGWGIYARKVTAAGTVSPMAEFQVSQNIIGNQLKPAICTLANGYVAIAWVSDIARSGWTVDVFGRIFTQAGVPVTREFMINSRTNKCVSPALAALANGGFTVAWAEQDANPLNGLNIWGRAFSASGVPAVEPFEINSYLPGDQYQPRLASCPSGVLAVWTSLGEDGDRDGVFGRFLANGRAVAGAEFQVNTTSVSQQLEPDVAWNGVDRFLVVWTSFAGLNPSGQMCGFDLFGQMYVLKP
jgi:hypothetical protein